MLHYGRRAAIAADSAFFVLGPAIMAAAFGLGCGPPLRAPPLLLLLLPLVPLLSPLLPLRRLLLHRLIPLPQRRPCPLPPAPRPAPAAP